MKTYVIGYQTQTEVGYRILDAMNVREANKMLEKVKPTAVITSVYSEPFTPKVDPESDEK